MINKQQSVKVTAEHERLALEIRREFFNDRSMEILDVQAEALEARIALAIAEAEERQREAFDKRVEKLCSENCPWCAGGSLDDFKPPFELHDIGDGYFRHTMKGQCPGWRNEHCHAGAIRRIAAAIRKEQR